MGNPIKTPIYQVVFVLLGRVQGVGALGPPAPPPPPPPFPTPPPPAARGGPGAPPHPRDPPSRAFDHLIKGCLYWISHSIMDSTLDKRGNPLNSRSIYWDTQLMIFFLFKFWALYCMCVCLFASLLSRPPGAKINGKRSLLIQGRMQIFEKDLSFWCISSLGTYLERCAVKFWSKKRCLTFSEMLSASSYGRFTASQRISAPMSYITFL